MSNPLHRLRPLAVAAVLLALLTACQTLPPPPVVAPPTQPTPSTPRATFTAAPWSALPGWTADPVHEAWPALLIGCRTLVAAPSTSALWRPPCAAAELVDSRDASAVRNFLETHFSPYAVAAADDGSDTGLVTGYYEPLLNGSRVRGENFSVPLHAPPDDLLTVELATLYPELKNKRVRGRVDGKKVVPYWPRAGIESGAARLSGKVLVYVEDPVEAFFLEIQGSGRIALADGTTLRLNYANQNGHPYRSIGRILIDRGDLPRSRASMQGIRAWVKANPQQARALLDENPSYVFFREVPPPAPGTLEAQIDGPIGTLGVPLLARRTIAVDARVIPLGAPVFLATTMPLSDEPLQRLTLAQDTGGAIRGPVRADFFWGFGDGAGREAGRMRQDGRMWLLWPKGPPPRSP